MATDIHAEVLGWVLDEISRQAMGEEFAAAATWGPAPKPAPGAPGGVTLTPAWQVMVTCRSPLVGEGWLYSMGQLGEARPDETFTRAAVADCLRKLREVAAGRIAGGNGRALAKPGG